MKDLLSAKLFLSHKFYFFLLLLFLPQQFGPHFWPPFSYVFGIRVDYLSPALYISTLLLFVLAALSYKDVLHNKQVYAFIKDTKVLIFLTLLLVPLMYAYSIPALYFGFFKVLSLIFLGLYASTQIRKSDMPIVITILIISALGESLLSIAQFINQGSLNGIFYFFGERYYTASSLTIAVMDSSTGLLVRPYGTFPHPNVLAYFLFISSVFLSYVILQIRHKQKRILLALLLLIIQVGLFLTFSRIIILVNVLFFITFFSYYKKKSIRLSTLLISLIFIVFSFYTLVFNLRFLNFSTIVSDLSSRLELTYIALSALASYPLGLGLLNFFYYEGAMQTSFTSVYLQPIHNIFLLLLAESGIICTILFVYFLGLTLATLWRKIRETDVRSIHTTLFIILITSVVVGMFDHYLVTIQQGQLLAAILLGLSWNRNIQ